MILLLSGPTGAGKNAVARLLAERRERCAVIDFDVVRNMFVKPHRAPWEGEEGRKQNLLGVRQVAKLVAGFAEAGHDVIVLDVLSDETAALYRSLLVRFRVTVVQLMPSWEVVERRNRERAGREGEPRLKPDELRWVYEMQRDFRAYDAIIDTGAKTAEQTAEIVLARW